MIVSKELVADVKRSFGLNLYESRLWLALISKGISTAGELAELGNVPRSRTYDVLEALQGKGLISVKRGTRPLKYLAIPIDDAIENSKKHIEKITVSKKNEINKLENEIALLSNIFSEGQRSTEQTERIGVLKSKENVMHQTGSMIRSAKENLHLILPSKELSYLAEHQLESLKSAKDRGVGITLITDGKAPSQLSAVAEIKQSSIKKRMIIKDNSETLFMIFPHGEMHDMYDAGIWISSPYFSGAISSLLKHA